MQMLLRPGASRQARSGGAPVSLLCRLAERLLPLFSNEAGHQIDLVASLELHVLQDLLGVRHAELRSHDGRVTAIERRCVAGRIEPELAEPDRCPLLTLHHSDRRGHVHELDRVVQMDRERRGHGAAVGSRLPALTPANEHPTPGVRPQLDAVDLDRGLRHDAGRRELYQLPAFPESARDDHGREDTDGQESGSGREQPAGPAYRRLHHTRTPAATTQSGRTTSIARKMRCICDLVRRTSRGTGIRTATVGACSSRTAQRTIARARSLLAMYGRKELLAKSPSPTTTSRNGLDPGAAPGHVPSSAAARVRRPDFPGAVDDGAAALSRPGWRSATVG